MSDCIETRSPCHVCGAPECCAVCCDLNTKNEKLSARVAELEAKQPICSQARLNKALDRVAELERLLENNEEQATPIEDDAMFRQCLEDYRVLFGVPPHDTMSNIAQSDGYFAASLKDKYPESMRKKASALAREEYREFEKVRAKFIGENNDE